MTTKTYAVAYNTRSGQYELHRPGCSHLSKSAMESCGTVDAESPEAAVIEHERKNEECWANIVGCSRRV